MSRLAACRKLERTRQYDAVLPLSPCAQPCVSPHCKRDMNFRQVRNSLELASPSVVRSSPAATPLAVPPSPNTLPCSWASHSLVYLNARVRRRRQRNKDRASEAWQANAPRRASEKQAAAAGARAAVESAAAEEAARVLMAVPRHESRASPSAAPADLPRALLVPSSPADEEPECALDLLSKFAAAAPRGR